MQTPDGLISAYLLDGKGGGRSLDWAAINAWKPADGVLWVHLDYQHPNSDTWLTEASGLDAMIIEALMAEETRPRSVVYHEGLLATLRGVNANPGSDPEDMVAIRIWCDTHRIITTRKRRLYSTQELITAIENNTGPRNTGEFLSQLADRMVQRMSEVIEEIHDAVDELEDAVISEESHRLRGQLANVRREAILLRRYLAPQRDTLQRLFNERLSWLNEQDRMRIRETGDTLTRYVEELDAARERATVVHEELVGRLSEQMNQRMYLLAIVAGLFLPLGFLTGLLGINVGGIPGSDDPLAFFEVSALLLLLVVVQLIIFRWKKWF